MADGKIKSILTFLKNRVIERISSNLAVQLLTIRLELSYKCRGTFFMCFRFILCVDSINIIVDLRKADL